MSEKESVDPTAAAIHAQAVLSVLEAALRPGKMANDRANLSEDYSSRDGGYFRSNGSQHKDEQHVAALYHARVSAGTMKPPQPTTGTGVST